MRPRVSFFDQAADKLREAMEGAATGAERMRLIQEALDFYHLHQAEEDVFSDDSYRLTASGGGRFDAAES